MSKYEDVVKQDTPRLVVLFDGSDGKEKFSWGVVGKAPVTSLIGAVVAAQAELALRQFTTAPQWQLDKRDCPESAFVIAYVDQTHGPNTNTFPWFVHKDIPAHSLLGMLEVVKAILVNAQMGQMVAAQQTGLVAPSGRPITRQPII